MIRFLKNRISRGANPSRSLALGTLEFELMEILDRLFKKGLLDRHKSDRAFVYSPLFSRQEWERRRAGNLVAGFLSGPHPSRELLLSCLLEAVGEHDATLLDDLEKKIRSRRKEILRQGQP
jgi:predicted transcriptional regulator